MPSSRAEAAKEFLGPLQAALRCVTSEVLYTSQPRQAGDFSVSLGRNRPTSLQVPSDLPLPDNVLVLGVRVEVRLSEDLQARRTDRCQASTAAYEYKFETAEQQELAAFHWHPRAGTPVDWPHVHVGPALTYGSVLQQVHLPTGRVGLEQVIKMAIEDWGVETRYDDWARRLERIHNHFLTNRTWS